MSGVNKQIAYAGLASTSIPLFVSDIFVLLTLIEPSRNFYEFTTSLDFYACFVFQLFFPQMVFCKMISIFSGISPKFYDTCSKLLEIKVAFLLFFSFGGFAFTQLVTERTGKNYTPIFLTCLSFFGYSTCVMFLGAMYFKLSSLQIILHEHDNLPICSSGFTSASVTPSESGNVRVVKHHAADQAFDKAKREFKFSFLAASTMVPMYCIVALFVLSFYSDGSQRSGYILSLTWKMACGLSAMNIPIGMILSKYTQSILNHE